MTLPPETEETTSIWLASGTRPAVPWTSVAASARKAPSANAAARVPPPEKLMIIADLSMVLGAF